MCICVVYYYVVPVPKGYAVLQVCVWVVVKYVRMYMVCNKEKIPSTEGSNKHWNMAP